MNIQFKKITVCCAGLALSMIFFIQPICFASFISIDTSISVTVKDNVITLDCRITNSGDEPAHKVEVEADFTEKKSVSHPVDILPQGNSIREKFQFFPKTRFSRMVIPLTIRYKDANQYAFSAISFADAKSATDAGPAIFFKIEDASISTKGNLVLKIKSLDQNSHNASIRIFAPQELTVTPAQKAVLVSGRSPVEEIFEIENFSAIAPSTYTILAIISEKRNSGQYDDVSIGKVHVIAVKQKFSFLSHPSLKWAVAIFLILYFMYQLFYKKMNKRG
jgi:hypothetical protein